MDAASAAPTPRAPPAAVAAAQGHTRVLFARARRLPEGAVAELRCRVRAADGALELYERHEPRATVYAWAQTGLDVRWLPDGRAVRVDDAPRHGGDATAAARVVSARSFAAEYVYVCSGDAANGHYWGVPLDSGVAAAFVACAAACGDPFDGAPFVSYHGTSRDAAVAIARGELLPSLGMLGWGRYTGDLWKAARYAAWDAAWVPREHGGVLLRYLALPARHGGLRVLPSCINLSGAPLRACACASCVARLQQARGGDGDAQDLSSARARADAACAWHDGSLDLRGRAGALLPPTRALRGAWSCKITSTWEVVWAPHVPLRLDGMAACNMDALLGPDGRRDPHRRDPCTL